MNYQRMYATGLDAHDIALWHRRNIASRQAIDFQDVKCGI